MRRIYSALDIGSSTIKLVVGEFINNKLNILSAVKIASAGYRDNIVIEEEKLSKCIKEAIKKAQSELNIEIKKIILNIPTSDTHFILTDDEINIDGEVTSEDIIKLLQDMSKNKLNPNDELICTLPVMFKAGDEETHDPFGKKCETLAAKCVLVSTDKQTVYTLAKVVSKCNLEIIDITTTGLVDYYNFKNEDLDNKNVAVINIGSTTSNIAIFSKGIFINNVTNNIGGYDLDREIALKYNLRKVETEYLKNRLSLAVANNADAKEKITIVNKQGEEIEINQLELSELVSNKLKETMKVLKNSINHLTKKEISYIIITGGLSNMKDISVLVNETFRKSGKIGKINNLGARDNCFSVSLGMLKYFNNKLSLRRKEFSSISEDDIEEMTSIKKKENNTIFSKVVSYFFDN